MFLVKFIISILLIIGIIFPKFAWMLSEGWKFKDAEPSQLYLGFSRVMSVVVLIVLWVAFPN